MVEQVGEGRAHGMIVFRTDHHVAIGCFNLCGQQIEIFRRRASGKGEVRLEDCGNMDRQWIDQFHKVSQRLKLRFTLLGNAQA